MGEVIKATGMSERTIYRMVTEGKLRQAQRPIPGRRPLPVFDPDTVRQVAEMALKARPEILPPDYDMAQNGATRALATVPARLSRVAETAELPPSELSRKLYLTEDEAVRYTGLGRGYLREAGKWRLIGERGARVYKRVELEEL